MSNCLCLACDRANSITTRFCTQCGAKLQIQERYRALKVIGQGGFGKTFLAQDESKPSQPRCVIKQFAFETINPNASQGTLDIAIRLFEQEAKRLNDLGKHSQIPELLSFTVHEGKQYLIQEFIDGETLEQELRRVGAFSVQQVRDALVEVLQILEFVHSKSVIHRDISPDNIIRRRSDRKLVLVDFGAAKHATATLLAKTGTSIGKASYGAPEQMLGKSVFQSDLFGLGVTCLHLLTNVEPFTLYDVLENEYQWRQFLNGKVVGDEFGKLLDRLTAQKVKDRPSSIVDILKELVISKKSVDENCIRNAEFHFNYGLVKYHKREYEDALAAFNYAIEFNPYFALAYAYRGCVKSSLQNQQEALLDFELAIQINPDLTLAYGGRGLAKSLLGDRQNALADYNQTIRMKAIFAEEFLIRGFAKEVLGNKLDAIRDYNEAIRIKPDFDLAYMYRGYARDKLRDRQGALEDFSKAIIIAPNIGEFYACRGRIKHDLGYYKEALDDHNKAINLEPNDPHIYNNRAWTKSALGDHRGALADNQKSVRLQPNINNVIGLGIEGFINMWKGF
jgi:serine/threonine protein kinase